MYKLKLMYYRAYEYQLLQDELNQLTSQGYDAKKFHLFTLFKKVDHPHQYIVDVCTHQKISFTQRMNERQHFLDSYLDRDFSLVYEQKELFIFKNNPKQKHKSPIQKIELEKFMSHSITLLLIALTILVGYVYLSYGIRNIDSFLTYGRNILYVGILLLFASLGYRFLINAYFSFKVKDNVFHSISNLRKHRYVETILISLSLLLIIIGFGEDALNARNITVKDHPLVTLSDMNVQQSSTLEYIEQSSFQVSHFYQALEYTDDGSHILYTKEYVFSSSSKANNLWELYTNEPNLYGCDSIRIENNIIYGYISHELACIIIQNDNSIQFVSFNFELTDQQINILIHSFESQTAINVV